MSVLSVHIGQAGINIANSYWERISSDSGVNLKDGTCSVETDITKNYFSQENGKYIPNAILVDTSPIAIEEVMSEGIFSNILKGEKEGTNYANAKYCLGKPMVDKFSELARGIMEKQSVKEIQVFNSFTGGAGSGLANLFQDALKNTNIPIVNYAILPSPNLSTCVLQWYNTILGLNHLNSSKIIVLDNESFIKKLGDKTEYNAVNDIIAKIPFALSNNGAQHWYTAGNGTIGSGNDGISTSKLLKNQYFSFLNPKNCSVNEAIFCFRGKEVADPSSFSDDFFKQEVQTSTYQKFCLSSYGDEDSSTVLSNHTGIADNLKMWIDKFTMLYNKRAFVHTYIGCGAEEGEFSEAIDDLNKHADALSKLN